MLNKPMPHNTDAEDSIISSVLIDNDCMVDILNIITPDDFYKTSNAIIFGAMCYLYSINEKIELITLTNRLQERGELEKVGGVTGIAKITEEIPIAPVPESYAKIIKDKAVKRKIIKTANNLYRTAFDETEATEDILNKAQREMMEIQLNTTSNRACILRDAVEEAMERLDHLQKIKGRISGIPSGYSQIDRMTSGFQNSDLIILAGRPGMGKSSFIVNILENVAMNDIPVAFFSLEMPRTQLVNRMLSRWSKLNGARFRGGGFSNEEWKRISDAAGSIYKNKLIINDSSDLSYMDIRRECRKYKQKYGIKLAAVDYLQITGGDKGVPREQEISSICRNMKAMAKELDIPVICLSQLNRNLEQRPNKRPRLSDLRESGSLEQESDVVIFLYRDYVYNEKTENPKEAEVIFAKHRNGMLGSLKLEFSDKLTLFYDPVG